MTKGVRTHAGGHRRQPGACFRGSRQLPYGERFAQPTTKASKHANYKKGFF